MTSQMPDASLRTEPARLPIAVTASDATTFDPPLRGFYVGTTAGDVSVTTLIGTTVVITGVQVGVTIACWCTQIKAATTAVGITGFQ